MHGMSRWILLCHDGSFSSNGCMCCRIIFLPISHYVFVLSYRHICGVCINLQLSTLFGWILLSHHWFHRMRKLLN